jgi:transcriptional regulator with XRE-family HTH domain
METKTRGDLRRRAGLTLFELGRRVKKSAGTLSQWERGQIQLSTEEVERIARVLQNELTKQPPVSSAAQIAGMLAGVRT